MALHAIRTVPELVARASDAHEELLATAASARTALTGRVERGDRVALVLPQGPRLAAWILGAVCAGAVAVPVAPRLRARQVRHVLDDCEPRVVVSDAARRVGLPGAETSLAGGPNGSRVSLDADDAVGTGPSALGDADVAPGEPAVMLYTSGSTGRPKGIVQSHRSLVDGGRIVSGYLGLDASDRILGVLSLSFDYGLNQLFCALHAGCALTVADYLSTADLLRAVRTSRATVLAGVPPIWSGLVDALEGPRAEDVARDLATLRVLTNSGGRLGERAVRVLRSRLPAAELHSMYGLSEAFRSTTLPPGQVGSRPRSIGMAVPEVEILVLRDDGAVCGPGEVGELVHCGAFVADGYWRRPEDTARVFRPDPRPDAPPGARAVWSGDLVVRDADGFLEFVARRDQQLKIRGQRISLDEVLDVVRDVDGVAAAVAFGLPPDPGAASEDPVLVAVVEPTPGVDPARLVDAVRRSCRRELPAPLVPGRIESVPTIPRTPHGKLDTVAVRDALLDRPLGF